MSEPIRGRYPGGPRRPRDGETSRPPTHVPTVAEIEAGIAQRTRAAERQARRRRVWFGFLVSLILAGCIGFGVGRAVREPTAEIALPQGARSGMDKQISKQVNRTLLELWKMEDVEYARGKNPKR